MAIKKSLTFDLYGKDKSASKTMRGVGNEAGKLGKTMAGVGKAIGAGLAVAGAAAVAFGVDSVKAFAEAQESQNKLRFALEKFPKAADTNIKALGRLNEALMKKTRFDDDAIASAQSVLLQYELTGEQLEDLTPLLLDFAARTGQDLTSASEQLGKALLGQGRALKGVGIDFVDTGTVAGNFDQIMAGLRKQVGGFAEQDAQTAAGKLEQLRNRFGEVQEKIGEALLPALDKLLEWVQGDGLAALEDFAAWFAGDGIKSLTKFIDKLSEMAKDGRLVPNIVAGIGAITAAQWLLNAAMTANPVGAVIAGIALLISGATAVYNNWNDVTKFIYRTTGGIAKAGVQMVVGVVTVINGVVNAVLGGLRRVADIINPILRLVGLPGINLPVKVDFTSNFRDFAKRAGERLDAGAIGGWDYIMNPRERSIVGRVPGGRTFMAEGGIVRPTAGGTNAVIGEAGTAEAVIPLSKSALAKYGLGGGGDTYVVNLSGFAVGSDDDLARRITTSIDRAKRSGKISRTWNS